MRRLTREQERELREFDESMAAIRAMRERPASGSSQFTHSAKTPWVRPSAPRPPLVVRKSMVASARPAASSAPRYCCAICGTAAHVDRKFHCYPCASEIAWRVKLATSGLKVVF